MSDSGSGTQAGEGAEGAPKSLKKILRPELFFAIVAPIGVDSKSIISFLHSALRNVGYETSYIKVTELMKDVPTNVALSDTPLEDRYNSYIDYANRVRELLNNTGDDPASGNDALAMLSVGAIMKIRESFTDSAKIPCRGRAYILDQFKRPEEILLLRRLYGRLFVQVSIHATRESRKANLVSKIRKTHRVGGSRDYSAEAEDLIRRDLSEEDERHGQRVREAFPMAEVIIDGNDKLRAKAEISRFVNLLFGHNFITPTRDEYGMYAAKAASLRSADLSRQVGAAIFTKAGEIVTLGANEVPKPGGGTYFEGDVPDDRDFAQGIDYNEQEKIGIVGEVIERLDEKGFLDLRDGTLNDLSLADRIAHILSDDGGAGLKEARIMDLLEFGRQIHAEMNAICDAARLGRPIRGATLYCTTYPCHMCAKLIIGSGIDKVVYIDPYPKSYAGDMYAKAIDLDSSSDSSGSKVKFQAFTGVAPFRYRDFFEKGRRKEAGGLAKEWKADPKEPNVHLIFETYIWLEPLIVRDLGQRISKLEKAKA